MFFLPDLVLDKIEEFSGNYKLLKQNLIDELNFKINREIYNDWFYWNVLSVMEFNWDEDYFGISSSDESSELYGTELHAWCNNKNNKKPLNSFNYLELAWRIEMFLVQHKKCLLYDWNGVYLSPKGGLKNGYTKSYQNYFEKNFVDDFYKFAKNFVQEKMDSLVNLNIIERPNWINGKIEEPAGFEIFGVYYKGVYSEEQQKRLHVDIHGNFINPDLLVLQQRTNL